MLRVQTVIFILFLAFVACTKFGKNITVQGRVLNPVTGEGIPNALTYFESLNDLKKASERA